VVSAVTALTHDQTVQQFSVMLNNFVNAPRVVLARTGQWRDTLLADSAYEQTVLDVHQQLTALLRPQPVGSISAIASYEKAYNGNPDITMDLVSARLTEAVIQQLGPTIPTPPASLRVVEIEQRTEWQQMTKFTEAVLTHRVAAACSEYANTQSRAPMAALPH
jgi:hypothetical protein